VARAVNIEPIAREDWERIGAAFRGFFEGRGEVMVDDERAVFRAESAGTGLELGRDGTSRSFMPLHGLDLRWDVVVFDEAAAEVRVMAEGARYTYRVPPQLS
jgi:hypothetical protein